MAQRKFYHKAREAGPSQLRQILDEKRAEKRKRSTALYKQMQARWEADADARKVGKAIRKAVREQERLYRVAVRVVANPGSGGRDIGTRNRRFEAMVGLTVRKPSPRGADGLSSFHCKFRSRGFGERRRNRSQVFKRGETVKALRYILRESAREIADGGMVSNLSLDVPELVACFEALEEFETHDRDNAQVYMSLVVSLPHELTAKQRHEVLSEICALLGDHDLGHVGVLHRPDPNGDARNYHAHILFSLRPIERIGQCAFAFSAEKHSDLNDTAFIQPFRQSVAEIMNRAMERAGKSRRFTALSDADRGLLPRTKASGKSTPGQKAVERRQRDLDLAREERNLRADFDASAQQLKTLVTTCAGFVARDWHQEAARVSDLLTAKTPARKPAKATWLSAVASIWETIAGRGKPPIAVNDPIAVPQGRNQAPTQSDDQGRDPLRQTHIAATAQGLAGQAHLPLKAVMATSATASPLLVLASVDRFDPRQALFAAATSLSDESAIQAVFLDSYRKTLDRAERELTMGSATNPAGNIFEHLDRDDYEFREAVGEAQRDVAFAAMLQRVALHWAAIEKENERKRQANTRKMAAILADLHAQVEHDPARQSLAPALADVATLLRAGRVQIFADASEIQIDLASPLERSAVRELAARPDGQMLLRVLATSLAGLQEPIASPHTTIVKTGLPAAHSPSPGLLIKKPGQER